MKGYAMAVISDLFDGRWMRRDIIVILGFLVLQFVLGMVLNLFVTFSQIPAGSSDQTYTNAIFTTPFLLEHFIVGVGLLLGSIWILIGTAIAKMRDAALVAAIGFFSILIAYVSGFEFLLSGFQNNSLSFTMGLGFIAALISYFRLYQLSAALPR